jgi:hypothetical protein
MALSASRHVFYGWIPAFAGMTHFFLMDCFALSLVLLLVLQALMV